ncbi:MAG TPA: acetylornithine carbamoyltransferase [Saprospiraceae bacterium]|nr:acetylornithine carbamoyltransferase [Saprospiraceae bacterium]
MKQFLSVQDVPSISTMLKEVDEIKKTPFVHQALGKNKTLGLVFLNPSLRTRMSTQKAASNLGMNVMVLNVGQESWQWEMADDAVMNGDRPEHIKDAARVMSQYCDIIGIRCFPSLKNKLEDDQEQVLSQFVQYCEVPVISLESATRHPLQSMADLITINEFSPVNKKPKVVLAWAPHIKALPQAVGNSFSEWMTAAQLDFHIAQPKGFELNEQFTPNAILHHDLNSAIKDADFIYIKNWSSYHEYGKLYDGDKTPWLLDSDQISSLCPNAKIMHCMPVRRNIEVKDELLDGAQSLIYKQAQNRIYSAQWVLQQMLQSHLS